MTSLQVFLGIVSCFVIAWLILRHTAVKQINETRNVTLFNTRIKDILLLSRNLESGWYSFFLVKRLGKERLEDAISNLASITASCLESNFNVPGYELKELAKQLQNKPVLIQEISSIFLRECVLHIAKNSFKIFTRKLAEGYPEMIAKKVEFMQKIHEGIEGVEAVLKPYELSHISELLQIAKVQHNKALFTEESAISEKPWSLLRLKEMHEKMIPGEDFERQLADYIMSAYETELSADEIKKIVQKAA